MEDQPGVLAQVAGILGGLEIGISSVIQPEEHEPESVPLVLMVHTATQRADQFRHRQDRQTGLCKAPPRLIRVETFSDEPSSYHDRGLIARYREYLPVTDATPVVSLNEGSTPLIHSPRLSELVGRDAEVFIKYEGLNPTGSFKDRGMTVAISKAVEAGAEAVICASTGNTSAAAAAYAARAGISCIVLLPAGKIAMGKLVQAFMYGAKVVAIDGNFDDALRLVREIGETEPVAIVNSINPFRLEGQKTASFEIIEELGRRAGPPHPAGRQCRQHHRVLERLPRISREWPRDHPAEDARLPGGRRRAHLPRQDRPEPRDRRQRHPHRQSRELAAGRDGDPRNRTAPSISSPTPKSSTPSVGSPRTKASSWSPPAPPPSPGCSSASDKERCAVFPLPAIPEGARIVCTVTGHGLKDPDIAREQCGRIIPAKAEKAEIMKLLRGEFEIESKLEE